MSIALASPSTPRRFPLNPIDRNTTEVPQEVRNAQARFEDLLVTMDGLANALDTMETQGFGDNAVYEQVATSLNHLCFTAYKLEQDSRAARIRHMQQRAIQRCPECKQECPNCPCAPRTFHEEYIEKTGVWVMGQRKHCAMCAVNKAMDPERVYEYSIRVPHFETDDMSE